VKAALRSCLAGALLGLAAPAAAEVVVLQNGRRIHVDKAWYEGAEVRYERDGGIYGVPRNLVRAIEPDSNGSVPQASPNAVPSSSPAPVAPPFRVRYEGGMNEALGMAVIRELEAAHRDYTRVLGFKPPDTITVVLQLAEKPRESQIPGWAEGLNDGNIRVPVLGVEGMNRRLAGVLRHELAHSFVTARTGGNCPTWLQEGVAQWLQGGSPEREDRSVAALHSTRRLHPLLTLEVPFQQLSQDDVEPAYAESLSAVAHIIRLRGTAGLSRLLAALGDGHPSDEALPIALRLSYPEFQKSWEAHLEGLASRTG
jgi:hypothetical protein